MGATTIQWTDETWNPVSGCSKVSQGCKNCYAERVFPRPYPGRKFTDVRTHPDRLRQPLSWRRPRRVFVNSMSDLFHESVPFEFICKVIATCIETPRHTYQILTKRPARMLEWSRRHWRERTSWPAPNVWLGVSCEDQETADERIPLLLQTPAAVRFVSAEPLLAPVDFARWMRPRQQPNKDGYGGDHAPGWTTDFTSLDWIIVGGESGPGARPFNVQWARDIIQQCRGAGVTVFMKQLGAKAVFRCPRCEDYPGQCRMYGEDIGHGLDGMLRLFTKDRAGGDMDEWTADLRVREFPTSRATT